MTAEQNDTSAEAQSAEQVAAPAEQAGPPAEQQSAATPSEWGQIRTAADTQPIDPTIRIERSDKLPPKEGE